ncbi:MAG: DUF1565 domain-containing protein, partial [Candidatus Margulisbacteria bacterium]|nr:DUF1565 domain-containing protein [Candidatus Margulisiibacteriota bacterium]
IIGYSSGVQNDCATATLDVNNNIISSHPHLGSKPFGMGESSTGLLDSSGAARITSTYNCVFNNTTNYSGVTAGTGDISDCPRFVDPDTYDYRLYSGSPCLETGLGGTNMGAYQGAGLAGSPYQDTVYVDAVNGSDSNSGSSAGTGNAWKTLTKAMKYGLKKINLAAGLYDNTVNGEVFPMALGNDRHVLGSSSTNTTIECTSTSGQLGFDIGRNSTLESIAFYFNTGGMMDTLIKCTGSNAQVRYCRVMANGISGNTGIEVSADLFKIYKSEVHGSKSDFSGNGISITASPLTAATVESCTLVNNLIGISYNVASGALDVINSIIASAPEAAVASGSYGINLQSAGTVNAVYNDIYNSETNYNQCSGGIGSITVEAGFTDVPHNNYHLLATSECIDAGDPDPRYNDPDGTRADLGAYYYDQTPPPPPPPPTYYVDAVNGDNSNDGSSGSPWKTLSYASTQCAYADRIIVAQGTYNSANGEAFPITFTLDKIHISGESTSLCSIEGTSAADVLVINGANCTIEGLTIKPGGTSTNRDGIDVGGVDAYVYNCIFKTASANYNNGVYFNTNGSGTVSTCWMYNLDTGVTDRTDESLLVTVTYCTIEGSDVAGIYNYCADTANPNFLIARYNYIYCTAYDAGNSFGIENVNYPTVATLEYNSIIKHTYGIYNSAGNANTKIFANNNIISSNPELNIAAGSSSHGINTASANKIIPSYNNVFNCATNYTGTSETAGGLSACPQFVNPDANDYRLFSSSPNIGTASDASSNRGAYQGSGVAGSPYLTTAYVDAVNGNDGNTGSSAGEGNAWKTLTKASQYASTTIHVATGTYDTNNGESFPIVFTDSRGIYGAGYELSTIEGSANSDVIQLASGTGTFEGLTVKINGTSNYDGIDANGFVTVYNCLFKTGNSGISNGVTINTSGQGSISRCRMIDLDVGVNNRSNAGLLVQVSYCTIEGSDAAGIYINCASSSSPNFLIARYNYIYYTAYDAGSSYGIYNVTYPTVATLEYNSILKHTYGIYNTSSDTDTKITASNNIISSNPVLNVGPGSGSYGIRTTSANLITSTYNNVFNCATNYNGTSEGTGDIAQCPQFFDPSSNDYRLYSASPCIGTASDSTNMGAYQGDGLAGSPYLTTAYVDAINGSDSNAGSSAGEGNAWKTLTKASQYASGTIHIAGGRYDSDNGETFPLVFTQGRYLSGAGASSCSIEGSSNVDVVQLPAGSGTFEGLTIKIAGTTNSDGINVNGPGQLAIVFSVRLTQTIITECISILTAKAL